MNITRNIIFKNNINNALQPKLVFVIIYIKNSKHMQIPKNVSLYKIKFHKQPNLIYL